MQNPIPVDIPADKWKKVATNVTFGIVRRINDKASYWAIHRITGHPPPVEQSDGDQVFTKENFEDILSSEAIDVYYYCPSKAGRVRVSV